jgi:hypothetical protein
MTRLCLEKALPPPDVTEVANFDPGARASLLFLSRCDPDLDPQFRLDRSANS